MSDKDDKMMNHTIPINNRIILIVLALSLSGLLIVLASGLAPNTAYAKLSPSVSFPPNNDDKSISSSQGTRPASTLGPVPPLFPPPSGQPELSALKSVHQQTRHVQSNLHQSNSKVHHNRPKVHTLSMGCLTVLISGRIPQTVQYNKAFRCIS